MYAHISPHTWNVQVKRVITCKHAHTRVPIHTPMLASIDKYNINPLCIMHMRKLTQNRMYSFNLYVICFCLCGVFSYYHSYYKLEVKQALVITADRPKQCILWNFQLNNHWMESLDYCNYPICVNSEKSQYLKSSPNHNCFVIIVCQIQKYAS